jgi:cardiolipin synthase
MRLLLANSKAQLSQRNRVQLLQNGRETYPALLAALEQAEHHIHLQYYIFEGGKISQEIGERLQAKATAGVEVRLLYDAFGSLELPGNFLRELEDKGVKTARFGPIRFPFFAHNLNYRNHRKVAVIDGKVGFTGGVNISDKYLRDDPELGLWRDTHLQVEGEAVHGLQAVFLNDWNYVQDEEEIQGPVYFPQDFPSPGPLVQIAPSGPDSPWWGILQAYFSAIALAEDHVYISTPYFIPNSALRTVLTTKAMSGVDVRILLPGRSDIPIQRYAAFSFVEELLQAGVKVYCYQGGFNHGKTMSVDGHFASVGTANMDLRSFRKNFEVNAFVYDEAFTQKLEKAFLDDLQASEQLDYETYRRRPKRRKVAEALGRLVSPAL